MHRKFNIIHKVQKAPYIAYDEDPETYNLFPLVELEEIIYNKTPLFNDLYIRIKTEIEYRLAVKIIIREEILK